jgi:hypothetical protein
MSNGAKHASLKLNPAIATSLQHCKRLQLMANSAACSSVGAHQKPSSPAAGEYDYSLDLID